MFSSILIILVLSSVLLTAGAVTSKILGINRIGYASVLFLAVWYLLTLAYAMPFRWHAWVGDITLLTQFLILGFIHFRKKTQPHLRTTQPNTAYQHVDALLYLMILLAISIPTFVLPVPLDTDAQGFGYLALTARLHGDLTNLAPFQPELDYLYAPGFTTINAYISERLNVPLHISQFSISAVIFSLIIIVFYDFGLDLKNRTLARCQVLAAILGTGLFTAYMDSHFTSILGLLFGSTFLAMSYRICISKNFGPAFLGAIISLGALVLAHPDTTITIALGYGAWLLAMPLAKPKVSIQRWCLLTFAVPISALALISPWFISVIPLMGSEIQSPFTTGSYHWKMIFSLPPHVMYQGGFTVAFSIAGLLFTLKKRRHQTLLAFGWLILILEFSTWGILEKLAPHLMEPIIKYHYPFSIAWHGPIVPYVLLTGAFLYWLHKKLPISMKQKITELSPGVIILMMLCTIAIGTYNKSILQFSKDKLTFFGAFSSHADVKAMTWIRDNTAQDAVILNFPGPIEADWVPVICERHSIYFRTQYFFSNHNQETEAQIALRPFWRNPIDTSHLATLKKYNVSYIIAPQVLIRPESFKEHFRWQPPFSDRLKQESSIENAAYLEEIFEENGAKVFKVIYPS